MDQSFQSSNDGTHSCTYSTERLRDQDYLSYSEQLNSLVGDTKWTDTSMAGDDALNWDDGNSGGGIDHESWPFLMGRLSDISTPENGFTLQGNGGIDAMRSR